MSERLMVLSIFVVVGLFALLFKDAFMATSEFLDDSRCSIGMKHYCDEE